EQRGPRGARVGGGRRGGRARRGGGGEPGSPLPAEPQRDSRRRAAVAREEAGQRLEHLGRGAETEHARVAGSEGPRPLAERFGPGQEVPAQRDQVLALTRESHPTADAIEEAHAQLALAGTDLTPEGGLTDPQPGCRLREPARLGDRREVAEVSQVHNDSCLPGMNSSRDNAAATRPSSL